MARLEGLSITFVLVLLMSTSQSWGRRNRGKFKQPPELEYSNETIRSSNDSQVGKHGSDRDKKWLSLFNIVQFPNDPCTTTVTANLGSTATNRNGTCLAFSECSSRGGAIRGNCASGFGVCCLFVVSASTGGTVSQNCTYLQSPGFPSSLGTAFNSLSYTLEKCRGDVCSFRLDFETFTIAGTGDTLETEGGSCVDTMVTTASATNANIPVICGENTGQHIYVEVGNMPGDTASIAFTFDTATNANRVYDIKVSQIPCGAKYNAPEGCLQYHAGLTGSFRTFNFDGNENHLQNQQYSVCIRQESGFCCVQYAPCANTASAMSVDNVGMANTAATDTLCTLDFIGIAASSTTCNQAQSNAAGVRNRYCGPFLSSQAGAMTNVPICDCTCPFNINVVTNAVDDLNNGADPGTNTVQSRGTCLEWFQVPCNA